jgi:polar amino acid transport system permease protein
MITLRRTETVPQTTAAPASMEVVPLRRPSRYVLGALLVFLIVAGIDVLLTNPRFQWDVVGEYLFSQPIMDGLYVTLWLTGATMIVASILGVGIAVMRLSASRVASSVASAYIWFFRGTPLLVQLVFWYNLSALFPRLELGIPFDGPTFYTADANVLITPLVAGLMGLALHEAAYMAEIIRSGILSVDPGQREAASALGMTGFQTFRRILLPQAVRVIVPPAGNELITTLKMTSLVSVVAVADLMYTVQQISARTFESIPLLIVASIWYLAIVSVLSVGQHYLERRFSRGVAGMERQPRSLLGRRRPLPAPAETREP